MRLVGLFTEVFGTGGIQRLNCLVCLALSQFAQQEGYQVSFLSLMENPGDVDDRYLEGDAHFEGFRRNKLAFVAAALREVRSGADFVYATHVNLAPLGLAMKLLRPSLRYGVALYGVEVWEPLSLLQRHALQQATFVTSISTYTTKRAIKLHRLTPKRTHLVHPALDPFWMSASEEIPLRQDLNLPEGKALLTVTRLAASEKYKGVDCVIQALPGVIEQVSDAYYIIVGTGTDLDRLRSLAEREGVQERVRFVGQVSEDALRAYYDHCDLFVLPSKGEGFGIVFLEAMFYKKPVIGGDHGGSRDVIEDGRTGLLVKHGDIEGLSAAIVGLLNDDHRRLQMGKAGYERLMSRYTYPYFRAKLVSLIREER